MRLHAIFTSFVQWLKTTEMFARPSKQLPGKWLLFEYYTEKSGKLVNVNESELKQQDIFWEIEFGENGEFSQQTNSPSGFLENTGASQWSLSKNYITFLHPADFRKNMEYQFAVEKGNLRLLKKDSTGKIELFGFFRKVGK
ncbi:MAG: hypothetical protein ACP5D9_08820 [Mariniphaga sp.]